VFVDANIKMEEILHNEHKWNIVVKDNEYCMTICAESFLILLDTMSERYSVLHQPRHK